MAHSQKGAVVRRTAALLAALCLTGFAFAAAFASEPSGAILVPVTPKPWLSQNMPAATSTVPAAVNAGDGDEGTSLDGLEDSPQWSQASAQTASPAPPPSLAATSEPSPAPTPEPTQNNALPGILGLSSPTVFHLLLIGTDAYTLKDAGRSDTMVLVQVDTSTCEVKLVSFLRDLFVQIPGHGKTRLNAAYVYGGESLLRQTLADRFGVTADRSLAVNFSVMVDLINRIGGVQVEVSERERKQLNSILKFYNTKNGFSQRDELLEESGVQMLTGKQALCYSRIRKIDSDFVRTSRQRKVLEGVYQRVKELDPLKLAGILTEAMGEVRTDMTLADAAALVPVLLKMDQVTFHELTVPVKNSYSNETVAGMSVLVPNLQENRDAIAVFLQPGSVSP